MYAIIFNSKICHIHKWRPDHLSGTELVNDFNHWQSRFYFKTVLSMTKLLEQRNIIGMRWNYPYTLHCCFMIYLCNARNKDNSPCPRTIKIGSVLKTVAFTHLWNLLGTALLSGFPLYKALLPSKYSFIWNKGSANIWNYCKTQKLLVRLVCKYFPNFRHCPCYRHSILHDFP